MVISGVVTPPRVDTETRANQSGSGRNANGIRGAIEKMPMGCDLNDPRVMMPAVRKSVSGRFPVTSDHPSWRLGAIR